MGQQKRIINCYQSIIVCLRESFGDTTFSGVSTLSAYNSNDGKQSYFSVLETEIIFKK